MYHRNFSLHGQSGTRASGADGMSISDTFTLLSFQVMSKIIIKIKEDDEEEGVIKSTVETYEEGCLMILEEARKTGMLKELWITMDAFRKVMLL